MPVTSARIAGRLSARFRSGMRPLAMGVALLTTLAAPLGYFILKRHDLRRQGRIYARQLAAMARKAAEERGAVWPYDAPKWLEALRFAQGQGDQDIRRVEILDEGGRELVPHELLWPSGGGPTIVPVSAPIVVLGREQAQVKVWMSALPAWRGATILAVVFGLLGAALGPLLYLFPLRLFREEDLVRALVGRALQATEAERARLSRELHDGVAQTIGAAAVALARGRTAGDLAQAQQTMAASETLLDQAIAEVRRVAQGLRPPALDDLGLSPALTAFAQRLCAEAGLALTLDIQSLPRLPSDLELCCYRIAQEALANVVRHARARRVQVALAQDAAGLRVAVSDDGCGFVASDTLGLGLLGARERIAALHGRFELRSTPGRGTQLSAYFPTLPSPKALT